MADRNKILENARQWFSGQEIPDNCPNEPCRAVNKWEISKVSQVNEIEIDIETREPHKVVDHEKYVVMMNCGWCNYLASSYEEIVPVE